MTASGSDAEQKAMMLANLPSSFGAARDKPLGKRAVREANIVRGGAGELISGASGRFTAATAARNGTSAGGSVGTAGSDAEEAVGREEAIKDAVGKGTFGKPEAVAVSKLEARKKAQAEIAAITAELARTDPSDAAGETGGKEGQEPGMGSSSTHFKPGGWRFGSSNGKGGSAAGSAGGRKSSRRTPGIGDRRSRDAGREEEGEEEEEEAEEEEEEEEEMTEEERIKMVVRRLGLPVSHEVQLSGHHKGVTALALDRAGGRVATGSNDYKVRGFGCLQIPTALLASTANGDGSESACLAARRCLYLYANICNDVPTTCRVSALIRTLLAVPCCTVVHGLTVEAFLLGGHR